MNVIAGPIFAAYAGFVRVRLLPGSNPAPNDDYFLFYEHPNNFEAEFWLKEHGISEDVVCYFNAGYAAGWCSEAAGVELDSTEVLCEAKGDDTCRFIMYPTSKMIEYSDLEKYQGAI